MSLVAGQTFAGYAILQRLGSGAMGEVYLVEHPRLPRRDALKVLAQQVRLILRCERFNREAQNAATLSHPHIVAVYDRGEYEGQFGYRWAMSRHRRFPPVGGGVSPRMPPDESRGSSPRSQTLSTTPMTPTAAP